MNLEDLKKIDETMNINNNDVLIGHLFYDNFSYILNSDKKIYGALTSEISKILSLKCDNKLSKLVLETFINLYAIEKNSPLIFNNYWSNHLSKIKELSQEELSDYFNKNSLYGESFFKKYKEDNKKLEYKANNIRALVIKSVNYKSKQEMKDVLNLNNAFQLVLNNNDLMKVIKDYDILSKCNLFNNDEKLSCLIEISKKLAKEINPKYNSKLNLEGENKEIWNIIEIFTYMVLEEMLTETTLNPKSKNVWMDFCKDLYKSIMNFSNISKKSEDDWLNILNNALGYENITLKNLELINESERKISFEEKDIKMASIKFIDLFYYKKINDLYMMPKKVINFGFFETKLKTKNKDSYVVDALTIKYSEGDEFIKVYLENKLNYNKESFNLLFKKTLDLIMNLDFSLDNWEQEFDSIQLEIEMKNDIVSSSPKLRVKKF